jgi:hypothetical protein
MLKPLSAITIVQVGWSLWVCEGMCQAKSNSNSETINSKSYLVYAREIFVTHCLLFSDVC